MVSRGHTLERLRDSSEYVGIAERENTKEGCWNERTRRSVLEREYSFSHSSVAFCRWASGQPAGARAARGRVRGGPRARGAQFGWGRW